MLQLREITYLSVMIRLLLSVVIGGIIGLERGRKNRPAGLRTYMLVCLGSSIVMMTNQYVTQVMSNSDPVRMGAQVISGIGFLGAGSIIVTGRNQIRGLTTAAGLWAAACIGLAIGIGFYEVAIAGGILIFIVLTALQKIDFITRGNSKIIDIYIELENRNAMGEFIHFIRSEKLEMSNIQLEHEYMDIEEGFAFIVTIKSAEKRTHDDILEVLRHIPNLKFLEEL